MENITIINQQDIKNLYEIIDIKINEVFKKLNSNHKNILIKYLFKTCVLCDIYFHFENFVEQLIMNNCQDIFSLMNILLPYYELNKSSEISSLDDIFKNKDNKTEILESTYFVDHSEYTKNSNFIIIYFENSLKSIENTFKKISSKLLPNWLNVFPITLDDYTYSFYYKNLNELIKQKKFVLSSVQNKIDVSYLGFIQDDSLQVDQKNIQNNFILGYDNLYGTIYNFLFNDIKTIKWMILVIH